MRRFFTDRADLLDTYKITGSDGKHIEKVLRMKVGENLILSSVDGYDYLTEIKNMVGGVDLKILSKMENETEIGVKIHLYQCLPKGSKFEFILQKAVELGVFEITPVISEFTISRLDEKSAGKKQERWQKIATEAAKQSQRGIIPKVNEVMTYTKSIEKAGKNSNILVFYEKAEEENRIKTVKFNKEEEYSIFIGSEGGFSKNEIEKAKEEGGNILSLGKRILRTETAPIVALSGISFFLDEF